MTRRAETITKAKNNNIYAWSEKDESGNYTIYKNGEIVGERVRSVDEISLSGNGYDIPIASEMDILLVHLSVMDPTLSMSSRLMAYGRSSWMAKRSRTMTLMK
jgi:hypothetical protein